MTARPYLPLRSRATARRAPTRPGEGTAAPLLRWARKGGITVAPHNGTDPSLTGAIWSSGAAPAIIVSDSAPATVAASGGESVSSVLDVPGSASEGTSPATPVSVPTVWDAKDPSKRLHPGVAVAAAGSTEDEGEVEETIRPVKAELQVSFFIILVIFVVNPLCR